jgi:hypothetical protein
MRVVLIRVYFIAVALVSLVDVGCEEQRPPEGQMKCEDNSECPTGWFCRASDSLCYASDAGEETVDADG